jgi:hypothetical protein
MELLLPVLFFRMDRVFGVVASDNLIPAGSGYEALRAFSSARAD